MPYVRIWISDNERDSLLAMARAEEAERAMDDGRKPRKVTLSAAARDCFAEGLMDMSVRQPAEPEEDEEEE